MLYLYAIIDQPLKRLPALSGLEQAAVTKVPYRDLAAVVSAVSAAEVPALEANVWLHELVVEELMADRAVLPVRFGTVLSSERAAQDVVREHYASFAADLDRVRGRVEMGVRVLRSDEPAPPPPSEARPAYATGRDYMLARMEEERGLRATREQAESLAAELHRPLARLATQTTQQVLSTPRLLLTAAYLLDRERVADFRQEVETLSAAYGSLCLLCTGPWPPYSFVSAVLPGDRREEDRCLDLTRN
jgi:hypothetical protein